MKDKLERLVGQLRIECELPTEADLDWMETAVQRHTGGFDAWWKQNRDELSGRDWMQIFISIWEASRGAKLPNNAVRGAAEPRTLDGLVGQEVSP